MPAGTKYPLGQGLLGEVRPGDELQNGILLRAAALSLTADIAASQHSAAIIISGRISLTDAAPLLLFALLLPGGAFAINGDSSIIAPDQVNYIPRGVAARTLLGGPILQGFPQVVWTYSTIMRSEFAAILKYYNPQSPAVTLTYPDQGGTWVQRRAIMRPPTYGTQWTVSISGLVLTFIIPQP